MKKIIDGFNPYSNDNEEEQANRDDRNYEIYSQLKNKISDFNAYEATFDFYLNTAENKYVTNFSDFFNFVDKYAEQQNKINYYILLSIISQILGILFILLLFKSILNKKKIMYKLFLSIIFLINVFSNVLADYKKYDEQTLNIYKQYEKCELNIDKTSTLAITYDLYVYTNYSKIIHLIF